MLRAMLSRRNLITAAIGAGAAWLGGRASSLAAYGDRARSMSLYGALAALSSDLRCPATIGQACLRALPANEASPEDLARLILADLSSAGRDCNSAIALRHSIRDRSRDDFRDGRIVTVDGWMLSLTETRVYALAGFACEPGVAHARPAPSSVR